jgi:hypothetical protein
LRSENLEQSRLAHAAAGAATFAIPRRPAMSLS